MKFSSSVLPLVIAAFVLFGEAEDAIRIVFCRHQLYHFCPRRFQFRVHFFILRQQRGVLLFQRLDGRQLLHTKGIKVPLRRLTGEDFTGVFLVKTRRFLCRQLAVLHINLACFSMSADVLS